MKKVSCVVLLYIAILINLSLAFTDAAANDEITFINDTPKNQVLSFRYELSSVAPLSALVGDRVTRLIWLNAGETYVLKLRRTCCNKYVGVVSLAQEYSFNYEKIQSGQSVRVSLLGSYQKSVYDLQENALTYQEQAVEEAKKIVKARKSVLGKVNREVNISNVLELAVIAPQRSRNEIVQKGFRNQYQIGSSRGLFDPSRRQQAEARSLSMAVREYQQISYEVMPKYGMVFSRSFFSGSSSELESQYGEDIYLLRWDHLQDRLTWTSGSPLDPRDRKGFIPWSVKQPRPSRSVKRYTEFQAWGPVLPSDIKSFIFTKNPPNREMLEMLARYGIEVYDGRRGCPISLYHPMGDVA